jgi:hypothetical protein
MELESDVRESNERPAVHAEPQRAMELSTPASSRSYETPLFPDEPRLRNFHRASFEEVRDRIANAVRGTTTDVSTIWGTPSFTGISERGAFGLVMCDFIHGSGDQVVAIDPGLRPSVSTPSAMAQLWTAGANGANSYVRNNQCFRFQPGFTWGDFVKTVGHLADPATIRSAGVGVVPFSWEPRYGTGRVITIAKSEAQHDVLAQDVRRMCGDALLS